MFTAVGFWSHWLKKTRVQTQFLDLNLSELEIVVALEGGYCVGSGQPSCLVWTTNTPARPHLGDWTIETPPKSKAVQNTGTIRRDSLSTHECVAYRYWKYKFVALWETNIILSLLTIFGIQCEWKAQPDNYKALYSRLVQNKVPLTYIGNKRLRRVLHYLKTDTHIEWSVESSHSNTCFKMEKSSKLKDIKKLKNGKVRERPHPQKIHNVSQRGQTRQSAQRTQRGFKNQNLGIHSTSWHVMRRSPHNHHQHTKFKRCSIKKNARETNTKCCKPLVERWQRNFKRCWAAELTQLEDRVKCVGQKKSCFWVKVQCCRKTF